MGFLYDRSARLVRRIYDSRVAGQPVLDAAEHFPGAARFAAAWPQLRDEALAVAKQLQKVPRFHDIMPEQAEISANDGRDWRMYILQAYGVAEQSRMAACPTLAALVRQNPEVLSASFSFMAPGKHIPPHRGPFRGITRFYMGLIMPRLADGRPAAVLTVDGQEYRVAEGEWMVWDDTFVHEVRNDGNSVRCVLLLDVWRRHMPFDMRLLSRTVIATVSAGVKLRGVG